MRQPSDRFAKTRAQRAVDHVNRGPGLHTIVEIVCTSRFWVFVAVVIGTIAVITQ